MKPAKKESVDIPRIQLILSEKRTSLAVLRTGIAIITLPLSLITVLIATSRYYDFLDNYMLMFPLLTICSGLIILGLYLIVRSVIKIFKADRLIQKIKEKDPRLLKFFDEKVD